MVVKTSTRQTIFLPIPGLVPTDQLKPGDLIGVNKDSWRKKSQEKKLTINLQNRIEILDFY